MALFTFFAVDTNIEESSPSGWLTTLGLLALAGMIMGEVTGASLQESLVLASKGIDFLSISLPL